MTTQISADNIQPATLETIGSGPTITNIQITDSSYNVLDDTAVALSGGFIKITGTGFQTGCEVIIGTVLATSVTFVNSTTVHAQVPALVASTYVVYLTNTDGAVAIRVNGLTYSGVPTWVTGSTLTGDAGTLISLQFVATDATTFAVAAGSTLPPGLTLSSGGLLSGTVNIETETLYNFVINAIDLELQDSPRTFSITISVGDAQIMYVTTLLNPELSVLPFNDDASTNNFPVNVVGDTRPNNYSPYTPGYYSFNFTAKTQYVSVPATTALTTYTGDFTFEAWIHPTDTAISYWYLWDSRQNGASAQPMVLGLEPLASPVAGQGRISYFNGTTYRSTGIVYYNRWTHVAYVRSGSTLTFYINGVASGTATVSGTQTGSATTNPIWIGTKDNGNAGYGTTGFISNLRVVNGTAVYTSNFTPSTEPLTAITNTVLLTAQSNRFIDNSTNNFAITRSGDVRIDGFDPFVVPQELLGRGSTYFDGTGDYLTVPNNSLFDYGSGNFTIECWVYSALLASEKAIYGKRGSAGTTSPILFGLTPVSSTNRLFIWGSTSAGNWNINGSFTPGSIIVPVNTWVHVACVRNGTTITTYVNGIADTVLNSIVPSLEVNTSAVSIGAGDTSGGISFLGYISNVRIVKGTAVYTAAFTPPTTPLTAVTNTSLLTCQTNQPHNNNQFLDSSTNNFLITRNGNTTQGAFSPYGGGWSNYFDGTGDYLTMPYSASTAQWWDTDYTIEMWVYNSVFTQSGSGLPLQVGYGIPTTTETYWAFGTNSARNLYFFYNNGSSVTNAVSTATLTQNAWSHIAMVYTNATATIKGYINGVEAFSVAKSGTPQAPSGKTLNVAIAQNLGYTGYISNLRIVRGTSVYTTNFTPPIAPLQPIAGTSLLTCADNSFRDTSTNNFAITRSGDVSVQKFNPFGIQTAMTPQTHSAFFDGNGDRLTSPADFALGTNGNWTIEAFVNPSSISTGTRYILGLGRDTGGTTPYLQISTDSSGRLTVDESSTVTRVWFITTTQVLPAGIFSHIALVQNGSAIRFYFNGILIGSTTFSSAHQTAIRPWIGEILFSGGGSRTDGFIGYISNVRYVNGVSVYSGTSTTTPNFTPPTQPLTAISGTQLLTCQSTTFIDNSTNNFAITITGNTFPSQINPFGFTAGTKTSYTPAVFGGSAYFDGTGDNLALPLNPIFAPGLADITVEAWVYPTAANRPWSVIFAGVNFGLSSDWGLYLGNGTTALFPKFTFTNTTGQEVVSSVAVRQNEWSHIAVTRTAGTARIFINGMQTGTANAATWSLTNVHQKALGASVAINSNTTLTGFISNLRVVNGQSLYTSSFVPPTAPLEPITNTTLLLNGTGAAVRDASMSNNLETVGDARTATNITRYGNTSMSFDGTGDYLLTPASPTLDFGTGDFTIETWVNFTALSSNRVLLDRWVTGNANAWQLYWRATGTSMAFLTGSSTVLVQDPSGSNITTGTWNHIAVTRSGITVRLFVNGIVVATNTSSVSLSNTLPLGVGIQTSTLTNPFNGYLSDTRITRGVARYTANFTPPTNAFQTK